MQKKFDDFQSDLKANEVRLAEMNEIAMQLMTLGQTEAAVKIQTQLQASLVFILGIFTNIIYVATGRNMYFTFIMCSTHDCTHNKKDILN